MSANYFYLLSTLPNLSSNDSFSTEVLEEAVETILRNVDDEDWNDLRFILHRNDNVNLLNYILRKYKDTRAPEHSKPYFIEAAELHSRVGEGVSLPDYIEFFALDWRDKLADLSLNEISDKLWGYFIEDARVKCKPETVLVLEYEHSIRIQIDYYFNPKDRVSSLSAQPLLLPGVPPSETAEKDHRGLNALWLALENQDLQKIDESLVRLVYHQLADSYYASPYSWSHLMHYTLRLMMHYRRASLLEDVDAHHFIDAKNRILESANRV